MDTATPTADISVDINALLARLSTRLAQQLQTIEIQQLQIEKLSGMLGEREVLVAELTAQLASREETAPEKAPALQAKNGATIRRS